MVKIVGGKALAAAHIANMGKTSNAASGNFDLNPAGRDFAGALAIFAILARSAFAHHARNVAVAYVFDYEIGS